MLLRCCGCVDTRNRRALAILPQHRQTTLQGNKNKQQNPDSDLRPPGTQRAIEVNLVLD